jgi:hypothetical protein
MKFLTNRISVHNEHTLLFESLQDIGVVIHLQTPDEQPRKDRIGVMRYTFEFDYDINNQEFHSTLCFIMGIAQHKRMLIMGNPALVQRVAIGYLIMVNDLFADQAVKLYKETFGVNYEKIETQWQTQFLNWLEYVPSKQRHVDQKVIAEFRDDFEDDVEDQSTSTSVDSLDIIDDF